ncbi:MAG: PA2778 family cysteine peptidase [Betaproteobacteria bacterium]|nr:PA2778 family cysteine peptidase [Betaproteobacteria bacterium]
MRLRHCGVLVLALFVLLLGGCAVQTAALKADFPADLPPQAELTQVPFFPQPERYLCGPESLSAALHAAGIDTLPQALKPEVYLPGREGSLQIEMLAAARRNGAVAVTTPPTLESLLREVAGGTPVVVLMNLSLPIAPMWHYAVVVGYDAPRQLVILRSGPERRQLMPWSTFEHVWARSGYWGMVALAPGRMPAVADERQFTQALIAFERVAPPARARDAYAGALQRWPTSLTLRMGLGNALYANGQKAEAAQAFAQAGREHPDSDAAWLNLAQTESELGHLVAARDAARRAASLAGPHADAARSLLDSPPLRTQ